MLPKFLVGFLCMVGPIIPGGAVEILLGCAMPGQEGGGDCITLLMEEYRQGPHFGCGGGKPMQ